MTKPRPTPRPWDGIPKGSIVAVVIVVAVCLAGFGYAASMWDTSPKLCIAEYESARTAADTARIDAFTLSEDTNALTCGLMRRNGTLARYEASHPDR
ncbi:hypothetical protein [Longimicrobium terrae]|uniref:Uncharacterized protein n=1 Tax=Longimicrobium terrae TaxID=1639882 RepID=A0A841H242_9BACT|nr:hypothetical protein [Longimicrobium terrae]MBB4637637.1 hypothetical protein [Longimicrobium terrae]MBB6072034.1 hypothetical protein [Longimicrobium terrae]NNC29880.1 hypothetical protein [Longimicrobium terrae]